MEDYSAALSFHQKSIEIREKCLPLNYPEIVKTYNNIGAVYQSMKNYPTAISFFQKSLTITSVELIEKWEIIRMHYLSSKKPL
jgi:tetratricopeptide (TPR) repeat protein